MFHPNNYLQRKFQESKGEQPYMSKLRKRTCIVRASTQKPCQIGEVTKIRLDRS